MKVFSAKSGKKISCRDFLRKATKRNCDTRIKLTKRSLEKFLQNFWGVNYLQQFSEMVAIKMPQYVLSKLACLELANSVNPDCIQ